MAIKLPFNHYAECFRDRSFMSAIGPKQAVLACLAELAQPLGHAHRLELFGQLCCGASSVEKLAARARLTFANTAPGAATRNQVR
jgi:hypothetical protein